MTKRCSRCGKHKPLDEFHNMRNAKDGKQRYCKPCRILTSATYQKTDKSKAFHRAYRRVNASYYAAKRAERRAAQIERTPTWLTEEHKLQIQQFYEDAAELSAMPFCDTTYQVDHIIPMRGKTISGLHVPWNLQILTESENKVKNNTY